jgi:adenine-specific DNA methylase
MKRAIEEYFPIVDINRLAVPERNAFKPIYTMHKWFARRSSAVFRAILLGAMKPAFQSDGSRTDIMQEFYKDHTNDPDTKGKVILDPFMGGGTTVVEALRLGCKVIGVDLNPVAWFIVKTEVESVDLKELRAAFDRLANRNVEWSGKPLKETLLSLYKTECPECGNTDADIIYTFWVKSVPCTTGTCNNSTPLFSDYIISAKKPSIRYYPDCECPKCKNKFDWEVDPASLVGNLKLMVNAPKFSAGEGRTSARWSYATGNTVVCPWCSETTTPYLKTKKPKRKKVPLSILYCPHCEEVWQYRGELPDEVACPTCTKSFTPNEANMPEKGKFICRGTCGGNVDAVIAAVRTLPEEQLLPTYPYALEGYCSKCGGKPSTSISPNGELFEKNAEEQDEDEETDSNTNALLRKNSGKFFKRISSSDLSVYKKAEELWEKNKSNLPYPKSEIPIGDKTKSGLIAHHYRYWHQMFNSRQLLGLSTLLRSIAAEDNQVLKEMLLSAFQGTIEGTNVFATYHRNRDCVGRIFARHDYQPKATFLEINIWGNKTNSRTLLSCWDKIIEGKKYNYAPYDIQANGQTENIKIFVNETIQASYDNLILQAADSKIFIQKNNEPYDLVITDPPYAGNVNYAELADFFFVWLRLVLRSRYEEFSPELTPKVEEIIENKTRGTSSNDFKEGLKAVFSQVNKNVKDDGLLVFTFHHAEGSAWQALLEAICEAGFYVEAVFPIHGESEESLHLMDKEAISYDLIHVCMKRATGAEYSRISWATIRQDIRRRAREEARLIESGRYGNEPLTPSDINILLIGKCLELYSKHYGTIVDHEDKPVPLHRALSEIKLLVDQLVAKDRPFPTELEDLDRVSYIYFTTLCGYKEISADEMSKNTRGIIEPSELKDHGLMIKGRENRGRSYEIKQPVERMNDLKTLFREKVQNQPLLFEDQKGNGLPHGVLFVDVFQFLIGTVELGENVRPWLEKFGGLRPQIRAALEYLMNHPKVTFKDSARKVLNLMDERTLFTTQG